MITERKPWEETSFAMTDAGREEVVNPASYAFLAAVGTAEWAMELLHAAGVKLGKQTIQPLAQMLMWVADEGQRFLLSMDPTERPLWNESSHTRSRGALRSVVNTFPIPLNENVTVKDLEEWAQGAVRRVKAQLRVAAEMWEAQRSGAFTTEPWIELAAVLAAPAPEPAKTPASKAAAAPATSPAAGTAPTTKNTARQPQRTTRAA